MNTFTWLLRREFWETRSAWYAPAICAVLLILAATLGLFYGIDGSLATEITGQLTGMSMAPDKAALAGLVAVAGAFFVVLQITQYAYLVDCLYNERKDRSILYWKSLPISDAATVLSKLCFALLVMPVFAAAGVLVTQVIVYVAASIKLGLPPALLAMMWSPLIWAKAVWFAFFACVAVELWALPLMAWVLLVSAFAPRSPTFVALLVPVGLGLLENLLLGSRHLLGSVGARMSLPPNAIATVNASPTGTEFALNGHFLETDLLGFFSDFALWGGLLVAALFVYSAIEVRRRRDPSA